MPIYEYVCNKCNSKFSSLQSVGTTEKDTKCPECGSRNVRKLLSAFSCTCPVGSGSSSGSSFNGGG